MKNNWTPDRPTKPGKYWLSVHQDKRGILFEASVYEVVLWVADQKVRHVGGLAIVPEDRLIGAQWLPYVEPPDPFAEPVPKLVEQLPSDAELVKSAIRLMRTPRRRYSRTASQRPLWSRVMLLFGHGSTYSRAICRAHGFDPDEVWMIEETPQ